MLLFGAQSFGTCYEDGSQRVTGVRTEGRLALPRFLRFTLNYVHSAHCVGVYMCEGGHVGEWLIGAQDFGTCYEDGSQRVAGVRTGKICS